MQYKCPRCHAVHDFSDTVLRPVKPRSYFIVTAKDDTIEMCSESVEQLLGYTRDELIGKSVRSLYESTTEYETDLSLAARVCVFPYLRFRTTHITKNELARPVMVTLKRLVLSDRQYIVRSVQAVSALDVAVEKGDTFDMKNCVDFTMEYDTRGNIVFADQGLSDILGYKPEEIIGTYCFSFVPKKEVAWREANMRSLFAARASYFSRTPAMVNGGGTVEFKLSATPNLDELGNVVAYKLTGWVA